MSKLVDWLEKYVMPFANWLGSIRWLVALRDAFVSTLPITISGSFAVLVKSLIIACNTNLHWHLLYTALQPVISICNFVWRGSIALYALYFAFAWGYQLARTFEVNRLAGAMTSLSSFIMSIANYSYLTRNGVNIRIDRSFNIEQLSTTGLFTAILFGGIGTMIFILCVKARIMLPIRSNMPHAELAAFESLVPSLISIFIIAGINYLFKTLTDDYFGDWLLKIIQIPLVNLGQGFIMVVVITLLIQTFGFFGLNGSNIMAPVIVSIWGSAQNSNTLAAATGRKIPYLWTDISFNIFGLESTGLALVIAILIFSKRSDHRTLAKLGLAPSVFNVNEPMLFGVPIVLNPIYFVPFVLAPLVNITLAYFATYFGLINRVQASVPNVIPPIIGPFLACNYDWRALVLSIINLAIAVVIWIPFVCAADKIEDNEDRIFYTIQY